MKAIIKIQNILYELKPSKQTYNIIETVIGTIIIMGLWSLISVLAFIDLTNK